MNDNPQEMRQELRLIEALLFAASEPLDEETLTHRLPPGADITALLARLKEDYAPRGVNLVRVAGRWALRTADDLGPYLRQHVDVPRKLSRAAIETLAIIAYHQPVTRAEIEALRGVSISRGTLDILLEAGWVRPKGRRRTPGRPATWVTTEAFLVHFGLEGVDDLPGIDELRAAGLLDTGRISLTPTPMQSDDPVAATDSIPNAESDAESGSTTETPAADESLEEDAMHRRHSADVHSPPSRAMMLKARDG